MPARKDGSSAASQQRPHYDQTVLLLQGGGALGAYQAGAFEALSAGGYAPGWVSGISIGAINAAIIAGNPPEQRIARLRAFWDGITAPFGLPAPVGDIPRRFFNSFNALGVMLFGLPKFFRPRLPSPLLRPSGAPGATSFYDTSALLDTLDELVDFDRINAGHMRLTLGAVDVETGNSVCFDNTTHRIGPEHVLASGALPPGFPPVEVDGRMYWDGGLVSNTPLGYVLRHLRDTGNTLIFQVDLWSKRGDIPRNLLDVEARRKEIIYSSRTRLVTDAYRRDFALRAALARLIERLPDADRDDPEFAAIRQLARRRSVSLVHLIYKRERHETHASDYEFSRASMRDHWRSGRDDAERTLARPDWLEPGRDDDAIRVFDLI